MRTDLEVAGVRATAELELQTRLLEAKQQELARREEAASQREAAAVAEQEKARKALAAAQEQQAAAERAMEEAERVVAQQRQQLELVRGQRATMFGWSRSRCPIWNDVDCDTWSLALPFRHFKLM
jgi:hypothetical protein